MGFENFSTQDLRSPDETRQILEAAQRRLETDPDHVWQRTLAANPGWGAPLAPRTNFRNGGSAMEFAGHTGYLAPGATEVFASYGAILEKFRALGGVESWIGFPTSHELGTADGVGRYNTFQYGVIYWHPSIGAFEVHGAILDKWRSVGAEGYGYPITDEAGTPDGLGRFNHFRTFHADGTTSDASIYWTPWTGAWAIYGGIRHAWAMQGWETGLLGYPRSDEYADGGDRVSRFEKGWIRWNAGRGAWTVPGTGGLQFRLRYVMEHDSTDDTFQGANDEVYLSAIGTDPSRVAVVGSNVITLPWKCPYFGDITDNAVRNAMRANPRVLADYELHAPGEWPRTYAITLFLVEEDNQQLAETFRAIEKAGGDLIKDGVKAAVSKAGAAVAGAMIGSVAPGLGNAIGFAVGAIAGAAYDPVIAKVIAGLANEVFTPITLTLTLESAHAARVHPEVGRERSLVVREHGGHYTLLYDWVLT